MDPYSRALQNFGELLRYLRKDRRMTQTDLAVAAGVSTSTIASAERTGVVRWHPNTTVAVYRALSSKFNLLYEEEAAFKSLTGLSQLPNTVADRMPERAPPPDNFSHLTSEQQHLLRTIVNKAREMYDKFGGVVTLYALEHLSSILSAAFTESVLQYDAGGVHAVTSAPSPHRAQGSTPKPVAATAPTAPTERISSPIKRHDTSGIGEPGSGSSAQVQKQKHA